MNISISDSFIDFNRVLGFETPKLYFKGGICTKIRMSMTSCGSYWLPFWRPSKLTNFLKKFDFDPLSKSLHGPDLDK